MAIIRGSTIENLTMADLDRQKTTLKILSERNYIKCLKLDLEASDPITAGYQAVVQTLDLVFADSLSLIPGIGEKRPASINLVGEKRFYPGTSNSDDLHVEPLEVVSNLFNSMFNPLAGGTRSKSAVMNKLAYLNSTLQGPDLVSSINGVKLSQEEHQFFSESWAELNKTLENRVKTKSFNNMPEGSQLEELETMIKLNKRIATIQTQSKFSRIMDGVVANSIDDILNLSTQVFSIISILSVIYSILSSLI